MSNVVFKDYPYWSAENFDHLKDQVGQICHTRKDDIAQVQNLPNIFISGRTVGKIPSSSADVAATDRINDFNATATYLYILIDNAGAAEWRRIAMGVW